MKIGIVDDAYLSLQTRLLQDPRNTIYLYVPEVLLATEDFYLPAPPPGDPKGLNRLHRVGSLEELIEKACDLYITGSSDYETSYEVLSTVYPGRVIGWSWGAQALEKNRAFAKRVLSGYPMDSGLYLPQTCTFYKRTDAERFLRNTAKQGKRWVMKLASSAQDELAVNRTIVCSDLQQTLSILQRNRVWFNEAGNEGAILFEEFCPGQEVCWGAWFNGNHFVGPLYSCIEHKGAQNSDRGAIHTGEVGTTMFLHPAEGEGRIFKAFHAIEPFLRGKCHGLVDMNTVLDPDTGRLSFLEFTMRFGRPTLEVMLAMLHPDFPIADGLCAIAAAKDESLWLHAYRKHTYGVGVSVFPYGYPLLAWNDEEADGRTRSIQVGLPFEFPAVDPLCSKVEQFFCTWDDKACCFRTVYNERQFVVVGFDWTIPGAIANAYSPLKPYHLFGHTWRDDVGFKLPALRKALILNKIVPPFGSDEDDLDGVKG
jgi:phosphoribosylamine-glycine ligase